MNAIFLFVIVLSGITLIFLNPSAFLPALFSGATESLKLAFSLAAIYLLWLGIFGVAEKTGLTGKLAKLLKKPVRLLFGEVGDAEKDIAINLSANLLGLGGIATPHGISAIKKLDALNNRAACALLTVIAATSLQIIPTSVISLRLANGSLSPGDIVLPTILSSLVSLVLGILLTKIFIRK